MDYPTGKQLDTLLRPSPLRLLWRNTVDAYWRLYTSLAYRYCERHGHKWGQGGTSFDGEYTSHWCECSRCGYSDSD